MTAPGRVAVVMPPVADGEPADVVEQWRTVRETCNALVAAGEWAPTVHGRHANGDGTVERDGVTYRFHGSDAALVASVADERPDVVLVHGLGWARLLHRMRRVAAPILLQHHGEQVFTGRSKWGHRLVRRRVAGYLFTGAAEGQAQPWIDGGVIRTAAPLHDVLEAAAMLDEPGGEPVSLAGSPSVLWVGRLIEGKDPITAVDAFAAANLDGAHLHLLATDRTMEPDVRARLEALGIAHAVTIHDPVPHTRMRAWYEAAYIFFSTSRREAAGFSLIEAATCGCVPVVSAIAPHRAIVKVHGELFEPGDVGGAASALRRAADSSREPKVSELRSLLSWNRVARELGDAFRFHTGTSRLR